MNGQFLIIDADDTLWENNIYFERAFDDFVDFLAHSSLSPAGPRRPGRYRACNARIHGYGVAEFRPEPAAVLPASGGARDPRHDLGTVHGFARADPRVSDGGDRGRARRRWSIWRRGTI